MRYAGLFLTAVSVAACAAGDNGSPSAPPAQSQTGTLTGQVIDTDSANAGLAGISIRLQGGSGTQTVTTGANGAFALTGAATGSWIVQIVAPGTHRLVTGETGIRTTAVTVNATSTTDIFRLRRPHGNLTGTVRVNSVAVNSGRVRISRDGFATRTADLSVGSYTMADLPTGTWRVSYTPAVEHALAAGETGTRTVTVTEGLTVTASTFQLIHRPTGQIVEVQLAASLSFSPTVLSISTGTTVRFVNNGPVFHTITPQNASQPGVFSRVQSSTQGTILEHTFNVPGQTYRFRCESHSSNFTNGMILTITVN